MLRQHRNRIINRSCSIMRFPGMRLNVSSGLIKSNFVQDLHKKHGGVRGQRHTSCSLTAFVFSCRRPRVLLLPVYRAGPADVRGARRSGLRGNQHPGSPAQGPRRPNRLPAVARLRPRVRRSSGERASKPNLRLPEDHHAPQRNARSHRVPHLRHQTQDLKLGVILFFFFFLEHSL